LTTDDVPLAAIGRNSQRRRSHEITQSLGGRLLPKSISPHIGIRPSLISGEIALLCSDGLTDLVSDEEIETILDQSSDDLGSCASQLLFKALHAGGTGVSEPTAGVSSLTIAAPPRCHTEETTGWR
jgi:protein phosphatase